MIKSPEIKALAQALAKFHSEVPKIKKGSENPFFHNKYADLATIIETVRPALSKCGLAVSQFPTGEHQLTTILMHESGEWIEDTYLMRPTKADPQGVGSSITYARRYALCGVLGIAADEDDDGNAASQPQKKVAPKAAPADGYLPRITRALSKEALEKVAEEIAADETLTIIQKDGLRAAYQKRLDVLTYGT